MNQKCTIVLVSERIHGRAPAIYICPYFDKNFPGTVVNAINTLEFEDKHIAIDRLQLTSSTPCWMTINKRILISFTVPVIQHGRQGLSPLNLSGRLQTTHTQTDRTCFEFIV